MELSTNDTTILEQIVNLDGECMDSQRCKLCPFRVMCLPEFLNPTPPTTSQRAKMALDVMTHHALVDESEPLDIRAHKWDKR
jgi:hypothetical protein